jgi:hypothetical protein
MASYFLEQLLDDVLREKGSLVRGQAPNKKDYQQVWDAVNRYVTATMANKQTLDVPNFCKIGWRIEHFQGKAKRKPHFQLAESFVRVHELDANRNPTLPDAQLAPIEEFNFSKAAIRYSQGLTKASMFTGLRFIAHKIGQACARHQVSIDFEIGKLLSTDRAVHFAFVGDLYRQEGLEMPPSAIKAVAYFPSRTFAPATAEGLSLRVRGRTSSKVASPMPVPPPAVSLEATPLQKTPEMPSAAASQDLVQLSEESCDLGRMHQSQDVVATDADVASEVSTTASTAAREFVRRAALERHLQDVVVEAEEAMTFRNREQEFMKECQRVESELANHRRAFHVDHKEELKRQMRQLREKRQAGRQSAMPQASQLDFPSFSGAPGADVRKDRRERQKNLKQDLDQQVDQKTHGNNVAKQQEDEFCEKDQESSNLEVQRRMAEEMAKKDLERKVLVDAWDRSIRLKHARREIDRHHMTAATKDNNDLPKLTADLRSDAAKLMLPLQRLHTGSDTPSQSIGSARRQPLGAAASLALRRDRQVIRSARK